MKKRKTININIHINNKKVQTAHIDEFKRIVNEMTLKDFKNIDTSCC